MNAAAAGVESDLWRSRPAGSDHFSGSAGTIFRKVAVRRATGRHSHYRTSSRQRPGPVRFFPFYVGYPSRPRAPVCLVPSRSTPFHFISSHRLPSSPPIPSLLSSHPVFSPSVPASHNIPSRPSPHPIPLYVPSRSISCQFPSQQQPQRRSPHIATSAGRLRRPGLCFA